MQMIGSVVLRDECQLFSIADLQAKCCVDRLKSHLDRDLRRGEILLSLATKVPLFLYTDEALYKNLLLDV